MPTPSLFWRSFFKMRSNFNYWLCKEFFCKCWCLSQFITCKWDGYLFSTHWQNSFYLLQFFSLMCFWNFSDTTGNYNRKLNVGNRLKYALTFFKSLQTSKNTPGLLSLICFVASSQIIHFTGSIYSLSTLVSSQWLWWFFFTWPSLNTSCTVMSIVPPIML